MKKTALSFLVTAATVLTFTGCWTPPNAHVQPPGEPRLIQSGVPASNNHARAVVESVETAQRILNLKLAGVTAVTCAVSPSVENLGQVQAGDEILVDLDLKLAIYVLKDGRLPGPDGKEEVIPFIAQVQSVDPSYRLLRMQYLNGKTDELKAGQEAKLMEMQPGDAVVLQSAEATKIKIERK